MKNDGLIGLENTECLFFGQQMGVYKSKKSWSGCHHLFIVYDASKLSTVYVVKSSVLGLQRAFENSVFPPSV